MLLDELEFRLWWRLLPPCARLIILRELHREIHRQRTAPRRWLYLARQPIVIGARSPIIAT